MKPEIDSMKTFRLPKFSLLAYTVSLALILAFAWIVDGLVPRPNVTGQDIYFSFVEGQRLRNGENPYARVLQGNMLQNQKYATYFPVFYELSFASQKLGLDYYTTWLDFWIFIFTVFELGTGALFFFAFARQRLEWIGIFAAVFWLFNRWTLEVVKIMDLDFIPIFFLIFSLILFPKRKWLGLFLLSLSLGFKQIAIFLVPLYLIWVWQSSRKNKARQVLLAAGVIVSVPLVSAIPFLLWNAQGFLDSMLFSATRLADNFQFQTPSLDVLLNLQGIPARFVMFALMLLVYGFMFRGHLREYMACLMIMVIFIGFNPVMYVQYMTWAIPLLLLAVGDLRSDFRLPHKASP